MTAKSDDLLDQALAAALFGHRQPKVVDEGVGVAVLLIFTDVSFEVRNDDPHPAAEAKHTTRFGEELACLLAVDVLQHVGAVNYVDAGVVKRKVRGARPSNRELSSSVDDL